MIKSNAFRKLQPIQHDPNKKDRAYGWATWVPSRTPQFKAHVERRHASSAIGQHQHGIIYRLENGLWVEVLNVPSRRGVPLECDACTKSTWIQTKWNAYNSGGIVFDWKDDPPQAYWLCNDCK